MINYLRDHHCRNVGVLKFRVHKAGHPVSFRVGPINDNMIERLENALIAVNPTESPVGITRDASHIADVRRLPRYDSPAGQKALFGLQYPLAWGNTQVTPDLMLTGVIKVRADLKSATVQIEAFGPDSPKQDKVVAFTVATDRSLLTDLGESFKVSSRSLKRKTRAIELDEDAVADAADDSSATKPAGGQTSTGDAQSPGGSLLYYEIRYDGQPQTVSPDPSNPKEFFVREPTESQAVSFVVRSLASERIGLVLMVNGKNTLYEEEGDASHCKAWVLDPGKTYGIDGFQVDNTTRKPFRVLSDQESASVAYGPNTGLIQFNIMRGRYAGQDRRWRHRAKGRHDQPGHEHQPPRPESVDGREASLPGGPQEGGPGARPCAEPQKARLDHGERQHHRRVDRERRGAEPSLRRVDLSPLFQAERTMTMSRPTPSGLGADP